MKVTAERKLDKRYAEKILQLNRVLPLAAEMQFPERVLQFGTGVLLRGLPDYFINKANQMGVFGGRIAVVKSTASGSIESFVQQDNLYTLHVKGIVDGREVQQVDVISAISRVIPAVGQWNDVLELARKPTIEVVISNTTEVGIVYDENDSIWAAPPSSFPAKLTALLYSRYLFFNGDYEKGWVVLPTELIDNNGEQLKAIVLQTARAHGLDDGFMQWVAEANDFCNTLVDRIVPGKLPRQEARQAAAELGYRDELAIMAEPFRLWAIQADSDRVLDKLSFAEADDAIVIAPDISKFKELKLRLLNGSHTFSCALAMMCGFETVSEAMKCANFSGFIRGLLLEELVPTLTGGHITEMEARRFSGAVLDRFANPFLNHRWKDIAMNYTTKMRMRNVPTLTRYAQCVQAAPRHMALGLAAFLQYVDGSRVVADEYASIFADLWRKYRSPDRLVPEVLRNREIWGVDLSEVPALTEQVIYLLDSLLQVGAKETLQNVKLT